MPLQKKEPKTLYKGRKLYVEIDPAEYNKTGKIEAVAMPIIADETLTKVERNGFEITYLAYLFDVFDQLGGQKYKVFKYIIQHKSADNTLIITHKELVKKTETSIQTVEDALKLLKEKGIISTRTGAIMLLPKIAHRGNVGRERYLMRKFVEFEEESEETDSTVNSAIEA